MTLVSLHRVTDDEALHRRARRGDRRARRILVRRHAQRAVELVDLMVADGYDVTPLATRVLDVALDDRGRLDDALVRAAVRVCAPLSTDASRLVLVLADVEGWSEQAVADVLGRPITEVAELRAAARATAGVSSTVRPDCRAWRLVVTRERATEHERSAGEAHLALCRGCRRRDAEQRETRGRLRTSGAAATAVMAADVVALSVPAGGAAGAAGIAGIVIGKAGVAGVGAAAIAVTIASAGIAAARQHESGPFPHERRPGAAVSSPGAPSTSQGTTSGTVTGGGPSAAPSAPVSTRTGPAPAPAPTLPSASLPPLPTATLLVPLPSADLTSVLPALPTVSPTSLLSPVASPSVPLPLPTMSLPTTTSLLGH